MQIKRKVVKIINSPKDFMPDETKHVTYAESCLI